MKSNVRRVVRTTVIASSLSIGTFCMIAIYMVHDPHVWSSLVMIMLANFAVAGVASLT